MNFAPRGGVHSSSLSVARRAICFRRDVKLILDSCSQKFLRFLGNPGEIRYFFRWSQVRSGVSMAFQAPRHAQRCHLNDFFHFVDTSVT